MTIIGIFGIFIIGGSFLIAQSINSGNLDDTEQLQNKTGSLSVIQSKIEEEYYNNSKEEYTALMEYDIEEENALDRLMKTAGTALQSIGSFFKVTNTILHEIMGSFDVEPFIENVFYTIIIVSIAFLMIYMFFRFQPR